MGEITIYNAMGKITQTIGSSADIGAEFLSEVLYVEGIYSSETHYIDTDTRTTAAMKVIPAILTSATITANGTDATSLTNLPDPCTVTFTGPGINIASEVTGGTATFTTDTPGTHTVKVVAFPYLDWEGTFNAI